MKIQVTKLLGDASVQIYNKSGELIHTESFSGKVTSDNVGSKPYVRSIPVDFCEYGHCTSLQFGPFEYKVVV